LRPRGRDRLRARVFQIGQADWTPPWLHRTTQTLLGCHHCPHAGCGLELCYGLCPEQCPKGLASGACGGSFPDGTCEFGHAPCFHHRVLALAAARHELDRLEEGLPCD
jgi:methylenetetrahydrofolate reductase (NADPH)